MASTNGMGPVIEYESYQSIVSILESNGFKSEIISSAYFKYTFSNIIILLDLKDLILDVFKDGDNIIHIHNRHYLSDGKKYWQHPPTKEQFSEIMVLIREEKFKQLLELYKNK